MACLSRGSGSRIHFCLRKQSDQEKCWRCQSVCLSRNRANTHRSSRMIERAFYYSLHSAVKAMRYAHEIILLFLIPGQAELTLKVGCHRPTPKACLDKKTLTKKKNNPEKIIISISSSQEALYRDNFYLR